MLSHLLSAIFCASVSSFSTSVPATLSSDGDIHQACSGSSSGQSKCVYGL
jgi:hypothetical protein